MSSRTTVRLALSVMLGLASLMPVVPIAAQVAEPVTTDVQGAPAQSSTTSGTSAGKSAPEQTTTRTPTARDSTHSSSSPQASSATDMLASFGKLLLALVAVLGIFWLFAGLMRRLHGQSLSGTSGLRVLGGLSVGQRERVVLVQVGKQQLLLGVTAHAVNTLHLLPEPIDTEASSASGAGDFRNKLRAAMQRGDGA